METTTEAVQRLLPMSPVLVASTAASNTADDIVNCPSCDARIKRYEVPQHCEQEIELLKQLTATSGCLSNESQSKAETDENKRQPWKIFQKVQRNRQTRLRQRSRKRPASATPLEPTCPICNRAYPQAQIQRHVEDCLKESRRATNGHNTSDDDDDADEGEEEGEEYEWAGQKRIRASSLLQGGYASLGIGQTISLRQSQTEGDDEDEDLNVDEDDTEIYGPPQYEENDVIPSTSSNGGTQSNGDNESDLTQYMRQLITGTHKTVPASEKTDGEDAGAEVQKQDNKNLEIENIPNTISSEDAGTPKASASTALIIDSLKAKLRYYENHVQSKFKCLICLDDYRKPAISVACWHVHCEECWLRSLGSRKLCPQCNLITTPKDLRRIYL